MDPQKKHPLGMVSRNVLLSKKAKKMTQQYIQLNNRVKKSNS